MNEYAQVEPPRFARCIRHTNHIQNAKASIIIHTEISVENNVNIRPKLCHAYDLKALHKRVATMQHALQGLDAKLSCQLASISYDWAAQPLARPGVRPTFLQLYIYDRNELDNRMHLDVAKVRQHGTG